jgi:hypothetical protein
MEVWHPRNGMFKIPTRLTTNVLLATSVTGLPPRNATLSFRMLFNNTFTQFSKTVSGQKEKNHCL